MHTRSRKHWYLKLNINGWTDPRLGTDSTYQFQVDSEHAFRLAGEAFDSPDNGILFGFVFGTSKRVFDFGFGCIFGYGDFDDYVCGKEFFREVGNHFEVDGASETASD
jgi:hypothetical protein